MNILIFDYLDRLISMQAPSEWLRDFLYHPAILDPTIDRVTIEQHIDQSLALHDAHYPHAQKIMHVNDKASFESIPGSEITYIEHGLAIVDFPNRSAVSILHNSYIHLSEHVMALLNPAQPHDRARLLHIQALIKKDLIEIDPEFDTSFFASHLKSLSPPFTLAVMEAMVNEKLNDQYRYSEPKKLSIFDLPYVQPAPTFLINRATTGWSVKDFSFSLPFVEVALEVLLSKKLLLTPEQEKSWMISSHLNPTLIFEPLHRARITKEHGSLGEHVANSLTLHSRRNKI